MKSRWFIFLAILILFGWGISSYLGMTGEVPIEETELGPLQIVYREFEGDYGRTEKTLSELREDLEFYNVSFGEGIAIFEKDPREIENGDIKGRLGYVVREKVREMPEDAKMMELKKAKVLKATSPLKVVSLNAPLNYPKMDKYIEEQALLVKEDKGVIEIYRGKGPTGFSKDFSVESYFYLED